MYNRNDFNQGYREKLDYEQQIMSQLQECREVFNLGDRDFIVNAVNTWELLVTPDISDKVYEKEITELDKAWDDEYKIQMIEYEKKCKLAMVPDVIDKPSSDPPIDKFKRRFQIVLSLFQRHDLLLQKEDHEDMK